MRRIRTFEERVAKFYARGVPMVLRTQGDTGRSAGAQHSQTLE